MKREPLKPEPPLRKEYPTGLASNCRHFIGRELRVKLVAGWGWHHFIDGVAQPYENERTYDSGIVIAQVRSFFECDGRLRGFTSVVQAPGHRLDGLHGVFFTMSDGEDYNFRDNVCPGWGARFGGHEPLTGPGLIPDFDAGHAFFGYATVYDDEESLQKCLDRLKQIDPRKQRNG